MYGTNSVHTTIYSFNWRFIGAKQRIAWNCKRSSSKMQMWNMYYTCMRYEHEHVIDQSANLPVAIVWIIRIRLKVFFYLHKFCRKSVKTVLLYRASEHRVQRQWAGSTVARLQSLHVGEQFTESDSPANWITYKRDERCGILVNTLWMQRLRKQNSFIHW